MFIIKLIRYLRGYVQIHLTGGFIERFFNICVRRGIAIWDVKKKDYEAEGYALAHHYKLLRPVAKATSVRLRHTKKRGVPFVLRRYRKRWGIIVGVLTFFVFLGVMSNFIWSIDINGNETIDDGVILSALEEFGVRQGAFRPGLDAEAIERKMMMKLDKIAWIAVNLKGSTADIEINERIVPTPLIDSDVPCNVIAEYSGQIKYLEVYEGQTLLSVGDSVMAGEIIVSGITEDKTGRENLKHARAKVIARVQDEIDIVVRLNQTKSIDTGEVLERNALRLFGFNIPLYWPSKVPMPYKLEKDYENIKILGIEFPFGIERQHYSLQREQEVQLTEEQAKSEALALMNEMENQMFYDAEIIDRQMTGKILDEEYHLKCSYVFEKDIAVQQEILLSSEGETLPFDQSSAPTPTEN